MSDSIDDLLTDGFLTPPPDFTDGVMARLGSLPTPEVAKATSLITDRLQWLALAAAGLLGIAELGAFMFGIWSATAAG